MTRLVPRVLLAALPAAAGAGTATRLMHTSTDRAGEPVTVTGSVLVPGSRWQGPGSRPWSPSPWAPRGSPTDAPLAPAVRRQRVRGRLLAGLLSRGYAAAGTPRSRAAAVLDIVRAARRLPDSGVPAEGPLDGGPYASLAL